MSRCEHWDGWTLAPTSGMAHDKLIGIFGSILLGFAVFQLMSTVFTYINDDPFREKFLVKTEGNSDSKIGMVCTRVSDLRVGRTQSNTISRTVT